MISILTRNGKSVTPADFIASMLAHPNYERFHRMKPALPEKCRSCEWQRLCYGGCLRNRMWNAEDDRSDPDFFCQSYMQIYAYADRRMQELGDRIRRELYDRNIQKAFKGKARGRNQPCAVEAATNIKPVVVPLDFGQKSQTVLLRFQ
ncbi:SPASM domain-containing protein [Paenibacillus lentus]|uniref:SPASM domain-containing protein n=1 Tax=Paenibacillus lentus TaxID=1338368 RepID=UPI00365B33B2